MSPAQLPIPHLHRPEPTPALLQRRRYLSAGVLAAGGLGWGGPLAAAPAAAALGVAPLPLLQRRLANGLAVILMPEAAAAGAGTRAGAGSGTVSIQVWYRVGGKDDPEGRSGFAHLFEHMMFKATRHMVAEQFDRLTEDVGGANNAFTSEDTTAYHADVPSNHLERLLWAEAERMANLQVDQTSFGSERAVVQEELRQRVLADPYGRLFNGLAPAFWQRHPYRRPVIGSIEDLDAATIDDVRRFHATYYRPDNAVLIVAGDFDAAQAEAWVDRYFGPLRSPATPVPRVNVREPRRERAERVALQAPRVPLPAVALMWQGPPAGHPDAPALRVASALLSGGESGRLHETLVYRDRIAQSAGLTADLLADAGMLAAWAIAAGAEPGSKRAAEPPASALAGLERALLRELDRLARGPIPAAELDKVRTGLVTQALAERQTPGGRAMAVGWAVIQQGDARAADRQLAQLQAVQAGDVQRVLQRYIGRGQPVTLRYTQDPAASPPGASAGPAANPSAQEGR